MKLSIFQIFTILSIIAIIPRNSALSQTIDVNQPQLNIYANDKVQPNLDTIWLNNAVVNFEGSNAMMQLTPVKNFIKVEGCQIYMVNITAFLFERELTFNKDTIKNKLDWQNCTFKKYVQFYTCTFSKGLRMDGNKFKSSVDFGSSTLKENLIFTFNSLQDSSFVDFYNTNLPPIIDFSDNANIEHEIDFTLANFDSLNYYNEKNRSWHYVNVFGSDIPKLKIDYSHFRLCFWNNSVEIDLDSISNLKTIVGPNYTQYLTFNGEKIGLKSKFSDAVYQNLLSNRLFKAYLFKIFPSFRYGYSPGFTSTLFTSVRAVFGIYPTFDNPATRSFVKMNLEKYTDFSTPLADEDIISIYEQMIKKFALNGQKTSEKLLDVEYQDFQNGNFILPHIWNCYGYHKEWIFYWTGIFLALFTVITFFKVDKLNSVVYRIENIPTAASFQEIKRKKLIIQLKLIAIRIWLSFVYTSSIFFLFLLKIDKIKFSYWRGSVYLIIMYTTGIVCIAYLTSFVLQK
jgi:hypothetical protein